MFTVRLIKAENLRRIFVAVFFLACTVVALTSLAHSQNGDDAILFGILLAFVPFGVLYEFIRYHYAKAYGIFQEASDREAVLKHLSIVRKLDFLKRYQVPLAYLDGFLLLDSDQPEKVSKHLGAALDNVLNANKSANLQYNTLLFFSAVAMNDRENLETYYTALRRIYNSRIRLDKEAFSQSSFLEAVYRLQTGESGAAGCAFQKVSPQNLDRRERALYYFYFSQWNAMRSERADCENNFRMAVDLAPDMKWIRNHKPEIRTTPAD